MKGLIIKDILNLKKSFNTFIPIFLVYCIFTYSSGDPSFLLGMITLMMSMLTVTSMAYDDLAKWDKLAIAMPLGRKVLVYSKYILSFILSISGVLLSIAAAGIIMLTKGNLELKMLFLTGYGVFAISILFSSIVLPLIYKFGVEKSRMMTMVTVGIPIMMIVLLRKMNIFIPTEAQIRLLLQFSPVFVAIVLLLSISISTGIFKNKDL